MNHVITIDGPAGSGKSTIARLLASRLNYMYLDTGAMYRAVALAAKRAGIGAKDSAALGRLCAQLDIRFTIGGDAPGVCLGNEDVTAAIRTPEMDMLSSSVSAVKEVRAAMTDLQRRIAGAANTVAEGRDMGSVVFSDAKDKFFLTASLQVRADRRYRERLARGELVEKAHVEEELRKRDHQDSNRTFSPLKPAKDARIIDTTLLTPDEVLLNIVELLKEKGAKNTVS